MAEKSFAMTITEVTMVSGKTKYIRIKLDGKDVRIPIDEAIYAYFKSQFSRDNPTSNQKKRFATLMQLLKAAYLHGLEEGLSKKQ
jgi:hypothetical protein